MSEGPSQERPPRAAGRGDPEEGPEQRPEAAEPRPLPFTQLVGRIVLTAVAVLFVVFSLFNRHDVTVEFFSEWEVPLIVLLLGSLLLGILVGWGWAWRRGRIRRARERREASKHREDEDAS